MTLLQRHPYLAVLVPISLWILLGSVWQLMNVSQSFSTGLALDMALVIPAVYLLIIWKTSWPKISVVPIMGIGIWLAGQWLHPNDVPIQIIIEKAAPICLEAALIGWVGWNVWLIRKEFKAANRQSSDHLEVLRMAVSKMVEHPKLQGALLTEVAMLYYALFAWKRPKLEGFQVFTSHKKTGRRPLLIALLLILMVETVIVHLLLVNFWPTLALILLLLSLYGAIQIIAHLKALVYRPSLVEVESGHIWIKNGLFGEVMIRRDQIQEVEHIKVDWIQKDDAQEVALALLPGLEHPNLAIYLKESAVVLKAYGIKKTADILLIALDEPEHFISELQLANK